MTFFFSIVLISLLVSSLKNFNRTSMKKIMAFSSINHLGWKLWILFLMIIFTLIMLFVFIWLLYQSMNFKTKELDLLMPKSDFYFLHNLNFWNLLGWIIFSLVLNH